MISVTGPRRTGKTVLLHQVIADLIRGGVPRDRVLFCSLDDPALGAAGRQPGEFLDALARHASALGKSSDPFYFFLDEIQRFERWELHVKKIYDLETPVRIVFSGSASSPIFRKSRESLLGRVKDHHILPFSFREFLLFQAREEPGWRQDLADLLEACRPLKEEALEDANPAPGAAFPTPPPPLRQRIDEALKRYLLEGGFPEVWSLPDWVSKQDYLYEHQVNKVIYEDLVLAAELRKPEALKRFYLSLLESPGREVSLQGMSEETGVNAQQIEKYLPLLEMTDLVFRVEKFRSSPLRVRRGRMKFYLVDLALRNAVLRLARGPLDDPAVLGLYAENLVGLALRKWRGAVSLDYYREGDEEVDFIVHPGGRKYLPVEVKFRETIEARSLRPLQAFQRRHPAYTPILVTKRWEDFGPAEGAFRIPLAMFLLAFD